MSDFAPFVAAVLRDKAVDDLLLENQRLRENLAKTRELKVTGPDGTPVYAKGMVDQGECGGGGERWMVDMKQKDACPLDQLGNVEIRLGGAPLLEDLSIKYAECHPLDFIIGCFDGRGMGLFEMNISDGRSVVSFQARIGPFYAYEDYSSIDRDRDVDGRFLCSYLVGSMWERPEIVVEFQSVEFPLPKFQEVLETQGIPEADMAEQRDATRQSLLTKLASAEQDNNVENIALITRQLDRYGGLVGTDEEGGEDADMADGAGTS